MRSRCSGPPSIRRFASRRLRPAQEHCQCPATANPCNYTSPLSCVLNGPLQLHNPVRQWGCACCSIIKAELEPFLKDNLPSVVSGMYFERLSFGLVPMAILGVRSVPSYTSNHHIAIGGPCFHLCRPQPCHVTCESHSSMNVVDIRFTTL